MQVWSNGIFLAPTKFTMKAILTSTLTILLTFSLFPCEAVWARSQIEVKPLYTLSNFSGRVPYDIVQLAVDRTSGEVLVLNPKDGDVRVFNNTGMEIYRTEPYVDLGVPLDLAVHESGAIDLLILNGGKYTIHRCDYRGEPVSELVLTGIPDRFSDMKPGRILWSGGLLYIVDMGSLMVTLFDDSGVYLRGYMLTDLLELEGQEADESSMFGFAVDREGNLLFTIPVQFAAYRVSPDGQVMRFGESGSSPGQFSVVSGIAADDQGNIFLSDRRRSVVMIYSSTLTFQREFGYRGFGPGNLIVPGDLVLDRTGKLYVTQMRKRGIQVYRVMSADGYGN